MRGQVYENKSSPTAQLECAIRGAAEAFIRQHYLAGRVQTILLELHFTRTGQVLEVETSFVMYNPSYPPDSDGLFPSVTWLEREP